MTERSASQKLDDAVEAIMAKRAAELPQVESRLMPLLRLAADLRDLPRGDFKARLEAQLLSAVVAVEEMPRLPRALGREMTNDDIQAALEELADTPPLQAHDVHAAFVGLPDPAMRFLANLNQCQVGVTNGSQPSAWERHPAGDELLYLLDGEMDVVTLTDDGPVRSAVQAGSSFVCPRGLWHRLLPRSPVSILFATPGEGIEHSMADDPRVDGRGQPSAPPAGEEAKQPQLAAQNVGAILRDLPELIISDATTSEEADAAFRALGWMDESVIGVMRFSGQTPWERHPDGDELLYVIEGEVEVTALTDDGPSLTTLPAGSVFVCPRGLWHRQSSRPAVATLFVTPTKRSEVSFADDPRQA